MVDSLNASSRVFCVGASAVPYVASTVVFAVQEQNRNPLYKRVWVDKHTRVEHRCVGPGTDSGSALLFAVIKAFFQQPRTRTGRNLYLCIYFGSRLLRNTPIAEEVCPRSSRVRKQREPCRLALGLHKTRWLASEAAFNDGRPPATK